ncbi:GNAT family N-acetyltransferase [Streptomyces sp. NPDC008150]|uniref:GNAT family N-acetyltransferase n=1 Tax=Streptomyces sp. NPDC008150 TaxID=3364816 RepID=UPI0036EA2771
MTTTLRPTEPLQHAADGARSRHYRVCVNGRPVGELRLRTHPVFGPSAAVVEDLRVDESDRGRGRATVAALAAEEIARGWGCARVEAEVPAGTAAALRLATALGYRHRNRTLDKTVDTAPRLPPGSAGRPMTEAEFGPWLAALKERYASSWADRGVPVDEARAKSERDHDRLLPAGLASDDVVLSVLEHEGVPVGTLWLSVAGERGFVYYVEADARFRGRGHGRTLMLLAEAQTSAAGKPVLALNVFTGNAPAERLYESLGYRPVTYSMYKEL